VSEYDVGQVQVSGLGLVTTPLPVPAARPIGRDAFAHAAGPDVRLDGEKGPASVYAIFAVEPGTNEVRIALLDDVGHLIRMIPSTSVADMLKTMASYVRR
jgi:hypothetical protein